MNQTGSVRAALVVAWCICVPPALAGEIVLFDGPGFQGYSVVYNGDVDNLGDAGFNDRAGSITVRQGTWEVCVDAYYEGGCLQLGPGSYPQLNPPFYRSISSLREVGGSGYPVAPPPAAPYIELFDQEYFQGSVMVFQDTVANLAGTGFNDQAASISVRSGTWEVCYDAYFQGGCMRLPPGDYPRLDPPFIRSISSLRPIAEAGYVTGGGYETTPPVASVTSEVVVPGASIGFTVSSYPDLVPVPGYPVYYAPGLNANYFFYDGLFWIYQRDSWYSSTWYNGPWAPVSPAVVPLFVLRVPVGYYRRPPPYFYGWRADAPPRWGDRWGTAWTQSRYGWDRWDRHAVPRPAPLPTYQRPYAGDRYPRPQQQQSLFSQNYHYKPQDPNVRPNFPSSNAQPPRPGPTPPGQPGGPSAQPPRPGQTPPGQPGGPSTQPPRPGQTSPGQPGGPSAQPPRPTPAPPGQQGSPSAPPQRPGQPPTTQPSGMPAQPSQQPPGGGRQPRPAGQPAPGSQQLAPPPGTPPSGGQPPQGGGRDAQRPQQQPSPPPQGQHAPPSGGQGGGRQSQPAGGPNSQPASGGGRDDGGGPAPRGADRGR